MNVSFFVVTLDTLCRECQILHEKLFVYLRIHTSAVTTGRSTLLLFITQGVKIKNFYYEHDLFAC
jgi:hypothetical protein